MPSYDVHEDSNSVLIYNKSFSKKHKWMVELLWQGGGTQSLGFWDSRGWECCGAVGKTYLELLFRQQDDAGQILFQLPGHILPLHPCPAVRLICVKGLLGNPSCSSI